MSDLIQRLQEHAKTGTSFEGTMQLAANAAGALEAANARIAEFERILDGLPQDAIDGGWTARGISAYAKQLETRIAGLEADLTFQNSVTDAARQQQAELLARAEKAEAQIGARSAGECRATVTDVRDAFEDAMRGVIRDGYVRSDLSLFAVWPDGSYLLGAAYDAWKGAVAAVRVVADSNDDALRALQAEIDRLNAIINTPHTDDFWKAVSIEAEHQRQRWGAEGDAGKTPADWFWLVGYLGGKALHSHVTENTEKAEHHIITTAAALANWHRHMFGKTDMRPGIAGESATESLINGASA